MYVFEEMINGKKLTEIINETHENVKYLPGHKLPENIVSQSTTFLYVCDNNNNKSRFLCLFDLQLFSISVKTLVMLHSMPLTRTCV